MANPLDITLHASTAESASASGTAVDISVLRSCVKLNLIVSAISGANAELTAIVETAPEQTGPWIAVGTFPKLTVARTCEAVFADCQRWVRVRWVLEGTTPSCTFAVGGQAHVLYATIADTEAYGLPKSAIGSVPLEERAKHALAATGEADGYLAGGYTLPLVAWPPELSQMVAQIAIYATMKRRGFQPQDSDELIVKGRDDTISWLTKIAKGVIKPPGIQDSTPDQSGSRVRVGAAARSGCGPRGW